MKKYLKIIPAALLVLAGCQSMERGVTITGEISGLDAGDMVSCVRQAANPDSAAAETVTGTVDDKNRFILHIPIKAGKGDWYRIWIGATPQPARTTSVYLDSGEVHISGKGGFTNAVYSGNRDMTEYNEFLAGLKKTDSLAAVSAASGIKTENSLGNYITQWVEAHSTSPLGTALLEETKGYLHEDTVIAYLSRRSPAVLNNLPAYRLQQRIKETADILPGKTAPGFTMPDTSGRPVSLKDFRGKFVLVDFWASWCGPCREENPNVVKAYNKYKDKGFTVLGVSLDQPGNKVAWLKAIDKDGLSWTQVSDLKYFDSAAAKLYHLESIPSNFLIDPQGVIIARNLRGEALEKRLAEVLSK